MTPLEPSAPAPASQPPYIVSARSPGIVGVAGELIGALTGAPVILALLVVNCVFAGSAAYYLAAQENFRHLERLEAYKLLERCLPVRPPTLLDPRP
jgi:hypothetical protein